MHECAQQPAVASLLNAIMRHCGADAIPRLATVSADDPFCEGGRGGAYCCQARSIYLCAAPWVGCREVAYELSHALNVCRGRVRCAPNGMTVQGADCGYFSPPDVACSELRAAHWTGRCRTHARTPESERSCLEWHARWAVGSCFPRDEHLEAHVRWARHYCTPEGADRELSGGPAALLDQQVRFDL